jgi:catechol 2,3-dioxygenase-like lactoylglutathione lyase family enzyme
MHPPSSVRRTGVLAVHSVNRFVFTVPDLDVAEAFYRTFGLDVQRHADRLALHTFGQAHLWGEVFEHAGAKRLAFVSYGIDEADLPAWRERLAALGPACAPHPLSDGQGLWLRDPDGTPLQLVVAPKVSPSAKCEGVPRVAVPAGAGAAPSRSAVAPVRPRTLSHILLFSTDVPRMLSWVHDVLGLRLSDRSEDLVAFTHTPHGSDHHLVAFATSHAPGLHHTSWDVGSLDDVGNGAEQMRQAGHDRGWGMGRHVLGSNYFHYVRDPWGSYAEYSFDIDFVPADVDWPGRNHPPHDSLYVWGPAVPEDFIRNHEQPLGDAP